MRYEKLTTPLPTEVEESIYTFAPVISEGLLLASFVHGDTPFYTPPISRLLGLESYVPDLETAPRVPPLSKAHILDNVYCAWQTRGYQKIVDNNPGITVGNWTGQHEIPISPLALSEQEVLRGMVRTFVAHSAYMRRIARELVIGGEHTVQNVEARMLSILSDSVAIPRVMAGIDFVRDRASVVGHIKNNYHIGPCGEVGVPHNLGDPAAIALLQQIPWKMPSKDMMPSTHTTGTPVVLRQATELLASVAKADPERLRKPLSEFDPQELRSPFRANPPAVIRELISSGSIDKTTVAQLCSGVPVVVRARRRIYIPKELKLRPEAVTANTYYDKELKAKHVDMMDMIRRKPLGRQLMHMVGSGTGRVRLPGSPAEHKVDADKANSLNVHGRLMNIARIFFENVNSEGILPPAISYVGSPPEALGSIIEQFKRVRAVHLAINSGPRDWALLSKTPRECLLRIGVIVEGQGKTQPGYSKALYFDVTVAARLRNGTRPVLVREHSSRPTLKTKSDLLQIALSPDTLES